MARFKYSGVWTKYDKHLAWPWYLSNITLMPLVGGCGAPLGEAGKDNLLEFILRPHTLSPSYRFITYSYSVARGKVALSAYKRLVAVCFSISKNVPLVIRYHLISLRDPCRKTAVYSLSRGAFETSSADPLRYVKILIPWIHPFGVLSRLGTKQS